MYVRHSSFSLFLFVLGILLSLFLVSSIFARSQDDSLSNVFLRPHVIEVQNATVVSKVGIPRWVFTQDNVVAKLQEAEQLLEPVPLHVGTEKITYTERRSLVTLQGVQTSDREFKDYEREIGLVLLDKKQGNLSTITIIKHGGTLIAPPGYQIEVVERLNSIQWNQWATQFRVVEPEEMLVLMVKYPVVEEEGNPRVVEDFTYVPYSEELAYEAILGKGAQYLQYVVQQAKTDLKQQGVMSLAYPDKLVADLLPNSFFEHIPLLEQSDFVEALLSFEFATGRVLGTLGYNTEKAFSKTGNSAGAFGWVQFTDNSRGNKPGTYTALTRLYPKAALELDFETGAANHLNSMKAAMLLHDYNLMVFVKRFGPEVINDSRLEEYLAASYNGAPTRAIDSLEEAQKHKKEDWTEDLHTETKGFIAKLRLLVQNNAPEKYIIR